MTRDSTRLYLPASMSPSTYRQGRGEGEGGGEGRGVTVWCKVFGVGGELPCDVIVWGVRV